MIGPVFNLRGVMGEEARTISQSLKSREPQDHPGMQAFDQGRTSDLLHVARNVLSGARTLVEFIDSERPLARLAGVETIGIEVSSILSGERVTRVTDAVQEATASGQGVHISHEGLGEIRRLEKLLAEASNSINKFTGDDVRLAEATRIRAERRSDDLRSEIAAHERRLEGIKRQYEMHGLTMGGQRKIRLAQSGYVTKVDFLGAAEEKSTDWGTILGIGTVAVGIVIVAVLAGEK